MGVNAAQITSPADTVAFADAARYNGGVIRFGILYKPSLATTTLKYSTVHGLHQGFANVLWMDGHVKAMRPSYPNTTPNGLLGAANNIGDLVNPQYPMDGCASKTASGECAEDYYFLLAKPGSLSEMTKSSWFSRAALRRGVLVVHLWLGIGIGLYFCVLGVTGMLLVFKTELTRPAGASAVHSGPPLTLPQILTRLHAALPEAGPNAFSTVRMPAEPGGPYTVFRTEGRRSVAMTVDAYDGHVRPASEDTSSWMGWVKTLHVSLLSGAMGKNISGYASLLAALLLLSGLWLWWPSAWRQLRARLTIKRGAGAKRITHDLHNTLGFYSFLLLLVVTLTGTALVFNRPVQQVMDTWFHTPPQPRVPRLKPPAGAVRLPPEVLLADAQQAAPNSHFLVVIFPTRPRQVFTGLMQSNGPGFLPYRTVYLDPYTGRLLQKRSDRAAPVGRRLMRLVPDLHFGTWGGLPVKLLYALVGLIPVVLFVTGLLMWGRRLRARASAKQAVRSQVYDKTQGE